jgi:hypothetical protein
VWAQFSQRSTCPPSAEVPAGLDRRHDGMINLSRLCRKVEENLVAFSQVRTKDFWGRTRDHGRRCARLDRLADLRSGAQSARARSASVTRAGIWREVLEFVRLPLPVLGLGRSSFLAVMFGQILAYSAFSKSHFSSPGSVSGLIASTGHSGSQTPQSMHSSGWMTSMFSPS